MPECGPLIFCPLLRVQRFGEVIKMVQFKGNDYEERSTAISIRFVVLLKKRPL